MNRTYALFKSLSLAALLVLSGTGQASAAEPTALRDAVVQTATSSAPRQGASTETARPETIRLAWDRVGMVA